MADDPSLSDFGIAPDVPPPKVYRTVIVQQPDSDKIAGFIGSERRRGFTAYTTLRGRAHYYRDGEGFAVSDSILGICEARNVSRVFVHDSRGGVEDGDIHEYGIHQYDDGAAVPEEDLQNEWDPQTFLRTDAARHTWEKLGNAMYVTGFHLACDRVGDRRIDPAPHH